MARPFTGINIVKANEALDTRIGGKLEENRKSGSSYDYYGEGEYGSRPRVSFSERFSRLNFGKKIVKGLFYSWLAIWEVWYIYCLYKVVTKTPESNKLIFLPFFEVWSLTSDPVVNVVLELVFVVLMIPVLFMWFLTSVGLFILAFLFAIISEIILPLLIGLSQVSTGGMIVSILIGTSLVVGIVFYIYKRLKN